MSTIVSAAYANRAEKYLAAASALLLLPELSEQERDDVSRARATMRRGMNMRESLAARPKSTEATA